MRKLVFILICVGLLAGCSPLGNLGSRADLPHESGQLKTDVDFIRTRLEKLQPSLNLYISSEKLNSKFDSLRNAVNRPMTSREFYFGLSEVIAGIHQGHTRTFPAKDNKKPSGRKGSVHLLESPFSGYDFEMFDNRFYISKNIRGDKAIKPFTELVTIGGEPPKSIIDRYRPTLTSDGYNRTFIERQLVKELPTWIQYDRGRVDSIFCQVRYQDTLSGLWLKRPAERQKDFKPGKTEELRKKERETRRLEVTKKADQGFDDDTQSYRKELCFADGDSTIGILRIRDFIEGNYQKYYRFCFRLMDSIGTKSLVLDLRDNPGGRLSDACELYSWLTDTSFVFIDKSQLASRSSILHANYFKDNPFLVQAILAIVYPFELIARGIQYLMVKQGDDGHYYFTFPESTKSECKKHHFKGDVYVLTNGGTFSASCILASNLKGSGRATFVGEETGGASEGTIAGKMVSYTLPESKVRVIFGLAQTSPCHKPGITGRGILPDVEIRPTLEDLKNGRDVEMEFILDKIRQKAGGQEGKK